MATEGKELALKSIAGAPDVVYPWPLTVGKGNCRGAEDEHDQAVEILDSIRWVCEDHPELKDMMGELLHSYNKTSWESMNKLVTTFNESITNLLADEKTRDTANARLNQRPTRKMLKHIIQQVYNTAIADPNDLNNYVAFTPEVYGETSFDLINQMIDLISPITSEMKFIDLGSGVGQVVLQVASLIDCKLCVGIEKASIPATRAVEMDRLFQKWMSWYGKKYSPYKLHQGDFLAPDHRKTISESTIVFVNNFAFGPEVDHQLKERFADLKDGARIVSSKPFCPLNFRITERNLSDIGTIMHVSVMDPLKGSVSWTDKPVSYYLHQIDSSKLERYFIRQQSHHTRHGRRAHNILDDRDQSSNGSWTVSRDSRASSIEKELGFPEADSPATLPSTNSGDDSDPTLGPKGKPRRGRPNKKKFTKKRTTPRPEPRVAKVSQYLKSLEVNMNGADPTPDTSVTESGPTSRSETPPPEEQADSSTVASSRPVRAAVVNAAAISEAQADILSRFDSLGNARRQNSKMRGRGKYKHLNEGDRLPRSLKTAPGLGKKKALGVSSLEELDMMHQASINQIQECNTTTELPSGCMDEKLNVLTPVEMTHEEIPLHVYTADGQQIPYGLHVLLESMKKQYLKMVTNMQTKEYGENIQDQILKEKERKEQLTKRVKQLENQIDNLIQDSLGLLKARLRELGITAGTPTEFIEKAKGIVCSHNDLQKKRGGLEAEIRKLEMDQEALITRKEKEILDTVLAQRAGNNQEVNIAELRSMVKGEIKACLEGKFPVRSTSPLPKVGSDVTLTKVPGERILERAPERAQVEKQNAVEVKKVDPVSLPKMEMRLPGDIEKEEVVPPGGKTKSENSDSQLSFARNKALAAPRANDDYEDRFKKLITTELAKPGEKEPPKDAREINKMPLEMNRAKVTLSPTKMKNRPFGMEQPSGSGYPQSGVGPVQDLRHSGLDPRSNFIPSRRPTDPRADPRAEHRAVDPRGFDPRSQDRGVSDPRHQDPRAIDPRLQDPRLQDPRAVDPRVLDPRAVDPRVQDPRTLPDSRSMQQLPDSRTMHPLPDSRSLQRGLPSDPRLEQRGRPIDPRALMDNRPQDPRSLDPRMQDPRSLDPRLQDPRALDPRSMEPRPQDPRAMQPRPSDPGVQDQRPMDPRSQDPRFQDPRAVDPRSQEVRHPDSRPVLEQRVQEPRPGMDARLVSPQDPRARPDSRGSNAGANGPGSGSEGRSSEPKTVPLPRDNRSVVDHISSEIERSLLADRGPLPVPVSKPVTVPVPVPEPRPATLTNVTSTTSSTNALTMSSQHVINMSVERAIQNHQTQSSASRLSKIIEESVRKDGVPEKKSIYATNRPNPNPSPANEVMEGLACPRGTNSPGERKPLPGSLPQVEGLAARFDSYFEKEKASSRNEGFAGRFSSPDIPNSRPTSTGSKSSLHTPDITGEDSRKRPASPLVSPSSKKPATSSSGDGSAPDETRRWQDEISMGFDRLVAMASEVDKRRKSAENSPQQSGSPRKGAADLRLNDASFDQNTLAAKFKAGLMQAGPPPPPPERGNTESERDRTTASGSQDKTQGPSPSFPGGNLPEHHFKKRYFNEEYQRQQQKETERDRPAQQEQGARPGEQNRPDQRHMVPDQSRGPPPAGYEQRRPGMPDMRDQRYDQAMRAQYDQSRGGGRPIQDQSVRPPHPDQSRPDPSRQHQDAQRGAHAGPEQGRHQDQRMYQDSRRGHYEQRHAVPVDQRHQDPRNPHADARPRPQMYPGQGYPDRTTQRDYPERNDYPNQRQLHPDQYRQRGPAPAGQQGYPGHPYPNPQIMQAMYRHQQMMYGNRPPPPPPNK
eukprot:GFUD01072376.1.p1 GENE.GFUD01072376.1~~GFUD01072376.1.p1  ORF type:complete len:1825 (+),score=446.63 GFUD01072376.1:95-5569(+)